MPRLGSSRRLEIIGSDSSQLTGPIGPIPLGLTPAETKSLYIYTFSEVIICDFLSTEDRWTHEPLVVRKSGDCQFPRGSIMHIHAMAWLCSVGGYYPFDAENIGWAVDGWEAQADTYEDEPEIEYIKLRLNVGLGSKGSCLSRIGYTWTAFTSATAVR
jgi:hypothetical protein